MSVSEEVRGGMASLSYEELVRGQDLLLGDRFPRAVNDESWSKLLMRPGVGKFSRSTWSQAKTLVKSKVGIVALSAYLTLGADRDVDSILDAILYQR